MSKTSGSVSVLPEAVNLTRVGKAAKLAPLTKAAKSVVSKASPADAISAVAEIAGAIIEHRRVREENETMREGIRAHAGAVSEQLAAHAKHMSTYLEGTFDGREKTLDALGSALKIAVDTGNVEMVAEITERMARVAVDGPAIKTENMGASAAGGDGPAPTLRMGRPERA